MSITQNVKKDLIKKYARSEKDTGSEEVQIAILSERIKNLTEHLKDHKHGQQFSLWFIKDGRTKEKFN